jgi:hypothetical protein
LFNFILGIKQLLLHAICLHKFLIISLWHFQSPWYILLNPSSYHWAQYMLGIQ